LVPKPPQTTIIPTKWVFVQKFNPDCTIRKYKARLVAQGFRQQQGVDFITSYSPVVRLESIRLLLFLASVKNLTVEYYDSITAYCQSSCSSGFCSTAGGGYLCSTCHALEQSPIRFALLRTRLERAP